MTLFRSLRSQSIGFRLGAAVVLMMILAQPLLADVRVVGGLHQELVVVQNGDQEAEIWLHNASDETKTVALYLMDEIFAEGVSQFAPVGTNLRSNAEWIELSTTQLMIPARSSQAVPYVVRVPHDTKLTGTYWSMLMVEALTTQLEQSDSDIALRIQQRIRTAVRLVTQIEGEVRPQLKISRSQFRRNHEGQVALELWLENIGSVSLMLRLYADVIDQTGQYVGRFSTESAQTRLLPHNEVLRRIDLPHLPAGPYQIIAFAENGDGHVFGARYELSIDTP